ncbi:MAG: hypothetical protein V4594_22440 [Bacteroidota bacterium]
MKTDEPEYRPMDLHGLNLCEETLRRFLNYSILLDLEELPTQTRLEIINCYERLAELLRKLRIGHNLFNCNVEWQKEKGL